MKTQKTFNSKFLLIFLLLIVGCTQQTKTDNNSTEQIWLIDISDPLVLLPDTTYIHQQLEIEKSLWEEKTITLSIISDYYNNPKKTLHIEAENSLFNNAYIRRAKVNTFIQSIDSGVVKLLPNITSTKTRSLVYTTISKHLQHLSKSTAKNKTLYVYSNLMENNPNGLSFYDKATYAELVTKPDKIAGQLQQKEKLPDLSGITINLMYYPNSPADNSHYHNVATFYKNLFESHNATVHLKASH